MLRNNSLQSLGVAALNARSLKVLRFVGEIVSS